MTITPEDETPILEEVPLGEAPLGEGPNWSAPPRLAPSADAPASPRLDLALRTRIAGHLAAFERREPQAPTANGQPDPAQPDPAQLRPASVALVLVDDGNGCASFVLTLRSAKMRRHANQFALPGGRRDPGEDAVETALRELHEEVGLELGRDSVLGTLDDYPTRSGFVMTPVVVWAGPDASLTPDPREVAKIYRIPLGELDKPDVPKLWRIPESERICIGIPLVGTTINAPTAAVIYQFREVAVHGRATRVDHFEQPVFAWK